MSTPSTAEKPQTPLGALVMAGQGQTDAEAITESIFMVKDISNAYLVTTADGDLLVNTGFLGNGARNKGLFAPHRTGALKRIIVTQAHPDHYGALPDQQEPGTEVITGVNFVDTEDYFDRLGPFLGIRSGKLWASMTRRDGPPPKPPRIVPDRMVETVHAFEQGGRKFEVVKTPGGETLLVLVNHLKSKGYGGTAASNAKRKAQAERIAAIYHELTDHGAAHVAVIGDFNDTPTSAPLAPLLEDTDLQDIFAHPAFDDGGYPGTYGLCNAANKIDYMLLSPSLFDRVRSGGVFRTGMWPGSRPKRWEAYPEVGRKADAGSDHAALWAEIDL